MAREESAELEHGEVGQRLAHHQVRGRAFSMMLQVSRGLGQALLVVEENQIVLGHVNAKLF